MTSTPIFVLVCASDAREWCFKALAKRFAREGARTRQWCAANRERRVGRNG
jgi:hypothetical protein